MRRISTATQYSLSPGAWTAIGSSWSDSYLVPRASVTSRAKPWTRTLHTSESFAVVDLERDVAHRDLRQLESGVGTEHDRVAVEDVVHGQDHRDVVARRTQRRPKSCWLSSDMHSSASSSLIAAIPAT